MQGPLSKPNSHRFSHSFPLFETYGVKNVNSMFTYSYSFYTPPLKSVGYYLIPSTQKIAFECLSVCTPVSASFSLSAESIF